MSERKQFRDIKTALTKGTAVGLLGLALVTGACSSSEETTPTTPDAVVADPTPELQPSPDGLMDATKKYQAEIETDEKYAPIAFLAGYLACNDSDLYIVEIDQAAGSYTIGFEWGSTMEETDKALFAENAYTIIDGLQQITGEKTPDSWLPLYEEMHAVFLENQAANCELMPVEEAQKS